MRIITDPRKAPSPESLTAFAKSMGLDEEAIQKLMGADHAAPAVPAPLASTAGSPELSAANNAAMAAAADKMAQPLSDAQVAKLSAQLPGFGLSQIEAGAQPTPASAHPALPTLGAALQGMTPADLASIQQIQITVAPAAVAGLHPAGNSATPSTASVLSLMGAGLNEHDIGALAASFDAGAAGGESSLDSQGSGGQSADAHGFAQSLPQHASRTAGTSTTAQASSDVRMSEVYDQLSDKMATEMAARMHKQLTDGEWKMKFGLRPANLGGVEIQLEMKDGKLNALIQADNPLTRDLLQNSSQRLRDALENFGIHAGQFHIGQDSRGTQQNPSRGSAKESQVGENSTSQVKNSTSASSPDAVSPKANASLLDLYA
jgi:flagellar hook-length control protein FliK